MSSAERSGRNTFAATPLDRCGEHRSDAAWLATQLGLPNARFLGCDDAARAPVREGRLCWQPHSAEVLAAPCNFLGRLADTPIFALREPVAAASVTGAEWLGLRAAAAQLERIEAGLFACAQALANWQTSTRHCGRCGARLELRDGGQRARCMGCAQWHFPRTDAAIIVIVEHGDACLLGRQASWPAGQYSALAGFVEPGESLADAVRREVREETGVEVLDCDFHSSQPWPFPASLMLGFTAVAGGRAIRLIDGELEDARWFTAADIAAGLREGSLRVSTPLSISYHLLEHWLRQRAGLELALLPRRG